jgi:nucleobase:cation symporter-1, NCS1 family
MTVLAASASYNLTYAAYVSDYSRYLPVNTNPLAAIASVFFGAAGSVIWLIALGAWLAVKLGATDGLSGLLSAGNHTLPYLGSIAVVLSAISLVGVTGMNTYGGILVILTASDSIRPVRPTRRARVIAGVLLTIAWFAVGEALLSSSSAISTLSMALTLMLYLLVPWTAANLTDFFADRRGHYAIRDILLPDGIYGRWAWGGGSWRTPSGLPVRFPSCCCPAPGR